MMKLKDKVAVMVGGEGALGQAVTKKFLAEGAKLVIAWNSPEEWEEARRLIASDDKGKIIDVRIDATQEEQVEKLMKKARDTFGSIDILLHMVGMFRIGQTIWETDADTYQQVLDTNLKTAFLCAKHAVKFMLEKGRGRIVFFPSQDALKPPPRFGAYCISKSGLVTLMQVLQEELKDTGITVNCIAPSIMVTPKTMRMPHAEPDKWVKPAEVADLLGCLCSDESGAVKGSVLKVSGKL
jgi:NAD(P)-dependent dehydrogenase (short-subunit alcohol dehydrogenase family)